MAIAHAMVKVLRTAVAGAAVVALLLGVPPTAGIAAAQDSGNGATASLELESNIRDGLDAVRRSDWPVAAERFTQAHLIAPGHPVPLYNLGVAKARSNHPAAAIAWFEAYLVAAPAAENAPQVRAEIGRLRQAALEEIQQYCDLARTAAAQVAGPRRDEAARDVRLFCEHAGPFVAGTLNDNARLRFAGSLSNRSIYWAELDYLQQVTDTVARDRELGERALFLTSYQPSRVRFAIARRFVRAIHDVTGRAAATAEIDRREVAWRAQQAQDSIQKADRRTQQSQATDLVSALRSGDLESARRYARELVNSSRVLRSDIMVAADGVRRVQADNVEAGLRRIAVDVRDPGLRAHALRSLEIWATYRKRDQTLSQRAVELRGSGEPPSGAPFDRLVLALAVAEDYEAAFALSSVLNDGSYFYGRYADIGTIVDLLEWPGAQHVGLAQTVFAATLRRRDREVRRGFELAERIGLDPGIARYAVYRNSAWAHAVAQRFSDAASAVSRWPLPVDSIPGSVAEFHLSRVQVLGATAVRAARARRFADAELALNALGVTRVPTTHIAHHFARIAAESAMEVAAAYAGGGDTVGANRAYAAAVEALYAYRINAPAQIAVGEWTTDQLSELTIERLRTLYPPASERITSPSNPAIAVWSRTAMHMMRESPAQALRRLQARYLTQDALELPGSYAFVAGMAMENLHRIQGALMEINELPGR